jgi:digeranylgeranylglycerophospholipid reductase
MRSTAVENTDAVVVGCGVAGGLLAGRLARDGYRVVVLEKRPQIGVPVRCGEAAGSRLELSRFVPVDESWVAADINGARLYAPDGSYVEKRMPGVGTMIERDRFDQALARQAENWGAHVRPHHEALGLERDGKSVRGVAVKDHATGSVYSLNARITVGADGIESFVGRWAGLENHLRPKEVHSAAEYLLEGDGFSADIIEIYVGTDVAPGGYAWVFPKGHRLANVGIGVHPAMTDAVTARGYLDRFVDERFPGSERKRLVAGGVSGSKPLRTMVGDGVLLVGEAARHNNPLSGGGIMNALEGAEEAHKVIAKALSVNDTSRDVLNEYNAAWQNRNGRSIHKFALMRELFFELDDGELNRVVSVLDGIVRAKPGEIGDYTEIFRAAFKTTPGVLWKARKLLW